MLIDITSANSTLRMTVPAIYPGGFNFEDYSAENMFEAAPRKNKEFVMSADGFFHAGWLPVETEFTVTLMPTSSTGILIDDWIAAEDTAQAAFGCNAVLEIPSIGARWNFVDGGIETWTPLPPGRKVLQARPVVFKFKQVIRSTI